MKFLLGIAMLLTFVLFANAKWINVAGEWDAYRLNDSQRSWFKSVRSKQGMPCCDMADGHPTTMDHREDGYYIPNPRDPDHQPWLKVPDLALTEPRNNPIGIATVWYVVYESQPLDDPSGVYIRCFVPDSEG
jgi:hypothetical protein